MGQLRKSVWDAPAGPWQAPQLCGHQRPLPCGHVEVSLGTLGMQQEPGLRKERVLEAHTPGAITEPGRED